MTTTVKAIFGTCLFILATTLIQAQIGIGTSSPAPSAKLEISSTTQGLLLPRMTVTQRNAISSPASGLIIFNTTSNALNIYFSGGWYQLSSSPVTGTIATLVTSSPTNNGSLTSGIAASGVSSVVSYTGGNGESHSGEVVSSTSVTGLTATLSAGSFAVGNGTLTYNITGTPSTGGTASFALNIGGQTATLTRPVALTIGQSYQGGKVAYMLQPGDPGYDPNVLHGFVATSADVSAGAGWGCFDQTISGADGSALGTGNQNTIDIMAGCSTSGIAARLCGDLVEGGYSDWFLPSKDELNKLYLNRAAIGGFSSSGYWSSTEYDVYYANYQDFSTGQQTYGDRRPEVASKRVRAIRSF